ncbi:hypothetical protein PMAYCL1PPCAC_30061, partial [Pristionchus mayeri]
VLFFKRSQPVYSFDATSDDDVVGRLVAEKLKRSAAHHVSTGLGDSQEVCNTIVTEHHQPKFGHAMDGIRVEIQQDDEAQFVATYRVCGSQGGERAPCTGIDTKHFTSACVQEWENRKASIRPVGSSDPFSLGELRVPVACSCRVRQILPARR